MNHMLRLENTVVNLHQVTQAKFTDAYAGGEPVDEDPDRLSSPRPAELALTLTSVHMNWDSQGYNEVHYIAASESDVVTVRGEQAERAWELLCRTASFGVLAGPDVPEEA